MKQLTYLITFDEVSLAEANRYIEELRQFLLNTVSDLNVTQMRADPRNQDLGAILVAVLGTSSITLLARALGDWLQRRHGVGITIKTDKSEIIASNLTAKDAVKLVELLHPKE
jgi:Effector Associated Constant Component 1